MPILEVASAILGIAGGFANCAKYAQDLREKHREKRALATEASLLHDSLSNSNIRLRNEWLKIERHFYGHTNQYNELSRAKTNLDSLERKLSRSLSPLTLFSTNLDLTSYHELANRSWNLAAGGLQRLQGQILASPASGTQLMPYNPSTSRRPPLWFSRSLSICRNAKQYRENVSRLDQLARPVPGSNSEVWMCTKCSAHVSKVSSYLPGTTSDQIWIGAEGMFKAHSQDGWTCIWRVVDHSCRELFDSELGLLQHMKDHHITLSSDPGAFKLHFPADLREDCLGVGAIVRGREVQRNNFIN